MGITLQFEARNLDEARIRIAEREASDVEDLRPGNSVWT